MGRHKSSGYKNRFTPPNLDVLATKLFKPELNPTPRPVNLPAPPSLASSRLTYPLAEIDERPRWRVRRFKLWVNQVPSLLRCVLDPKKRVNLKRFAPFATPSTPHPSRGSYGPRATFGAPLPPLTPAPGLAASYQPPDPLELTAKLGGLTLSPPARRPPLGPDFQLKRATEVDETHYTRGQKKAAKDHRHILYTRLCQHKFILDVEHERRFRAGMREVVRNVQAWEETTVQRSDEWPRMGTMVRKDPKVWNEATAKTFIHMFKNIRRNSRYIYEVANAFYPHLLLSPVAGREEAHAALRAADEGKVQRKEERRAKRVEKHAAKNKTKAAPPQTPPPPPLLTPIRSSRRAQVAENQPPGERRAKRPSATRGTPSPERREQEAKAVYADELAQTIKNLREQLAEVTAQRQALQSSLATLTSGESQDDQWESEIRNIDMELLSIWTGELNMDQDTFAPFAPTRNAYTRGLGDQSQTSQAPLVGLSMCRRCKFGAVVVHKIAHSPAKSRTIR